MSTFTSAFYIGYMITLYGILIGFSVVAYVLTGKSLSAIARRRGIEKPWLAWVPVGSDWLLGCISDQYRYVAHGQERNARGKLLRRSIVMMVMATVSGMIAGIFAGVAAAGASDEVMIVPVLLLILACYGTIAVAVFYNIACYKAYFDLFRSCNPDKSLIYLLVGIFTTYPMPFFVYSCRNKDLGMPPRTEVPQLPCE
jgi:hypothetical protein